MSLRYNPFTGNLDLIGSGQAPVWDKVSSSAIGSSTSVVDSIPNTDFRSLKYIVTVFNDANTAYKSFELNVLNDSGSYLETRSHRLRAGDLNMAIGTVNNAGTFELQITNNESFDVQVEIGRLVLA